MHVSMAMVRQVTSPNPDRRGTRYPRSPPNKCNKNMGNCSCTPAWIMGSDTWATALPTNKQVDTTPMTGANGSIFWDSTKRGKYRLAAMPIEMGASTICTVEVAMPRASMAKLALPSKPRDKKGVMRMAPKVVAVVMRTDNATLPLAMWAHKLLD